MVSRSLSMLFLHFERALQGVFSLQDYIAILVSIKYHSLYFDVFCSLQCLELAFVHNIRIFHSSRNCRFVVIVYLRVLLSNNGPYIFFFHRFAVLSDYINIISEQRSRSWVTNRNTLECLSSFFLLVVTQSWRVDVTCRVFLFYVIAGNILNKGLYQFY